MSDDLEAVRAELARWCEVNDMDAIKAELARRGHPVDEPSVVDVEFDEVATEVKRRLLAAESDPMKAVAEAIAALAAAFGEMATSLLAMHRAPGAVIKTIERDDQGNMVRIFEEPA